MSNVSSLTPKADESGAIAVLPLRKILSPIDFSEASYWALDIADELAVQFDAELCLLHMAAPMHTTQPAGPYPGTMDVKQTQYEQDEQRHVQLELEEVVQHHPLKATHIRQLVKCGEVAEGIVATADHEGVDLIVMATHGLSGWHHDRFGSVAEKVMHLMNCPVLIIRAPTYSS